MNSHSPDWVEKDKALTKTFTFESFPSAIGFMVEVSLFCEKTDHHPEWKNVYNKVFVSLTTHDKKNITEKDKTLANHMDQVFNQHSPS